MTHGTRPWPDDAPEVHGEPALEAPAGAQDLDLDRLVWDVEYREAARVFWRRGD